MTYVRSGKWANAICWGSCGGRCVNKVYIVDGVPVRQKTDDTHADSPDFPQQRACTRGRAYRQMVFGEHRVKAPMKRKHWSVGGGNRELRGRDLWDEISWDEALDIVAGEVRRIKQEYGNSAIVAWGQEICRTLALYGGYVQPWGSTSWGTWLDTGPRIGHSDSTLLINDRLDLRNCEVIVLWGANPAWSSGGNATYHYLQAHKAGARFVCLDPVYTESAQVLSADWIPVRPATDHALALGLAHTLLTEDHPSENPLIDWDFLSRCAVGFGDFRHYVMGESDGTPKTAEWASQICGVGPERIRQLARQIGFRQKVALLTGWAPARVNNADSWPQVFMALGAMTGHIGLSGHMTGLSTYSQAANGGPPLIRVGQTGLQPIRNPLAHIRVNNNEIWDAVLSGKHTQESGVTRPLDVRMIHHGGKARLNQLAGLVKGIEAHRKVEFVVTQDYVWSSQCDYSDVVLPATTHWEKPGMVLSGNRDSIVISEQVLEPLYQAKDDIWIARQIGVRLGLDPNAIDPVPLKQQLFNQIAGTTVVTPDGSGYENLACICEADIEALGVVGRPQPGRVSLTELRKIGTYQVPRLRGDNLGYIAYEDFRRDPGANPLPTESGKIEIRCEAIARHVNSCGFTEITAIPTYQVPREGYEATLSGEFPLQLITPHSRGRTNSILNNVPWLVEAFPQRLMMSPHDARPRGIANGDRVLVQSRHGTVLVAVHVTERVMPGVAILPEGAWPNMKDGVDHGGSGNTLVGAIATGQGHSGWNSCNVQIELFEKVDTADTASAHHAVICGSDHCAFEFTQSACTGCMACQIACKDKNGLPVGTFIRRVVQVESGSYPTPAVRYVSCSCRHCDEAECLKACPQGAIHKTGDAIIVQDNLCNGCGACVNACAHGAIVIGPSGRALKCDLCTDIVGIGEEPACVAACAMRALRRRQ